MGKRLQKVTKGYTFYKVPSQFQAQPDKSRQNPTLFTKSLYSFKAGDTRNPYSTLSPDMTRLYPPRSQGAFICSGWRLWQELPVSPLEKTQIHSNMGTLRFAEDQVRQLTRTMAAEAAQDERVPLLVQLPGIRMVNAMTILAAIGEIERFPSPKHLVGYAGLGASVHISGMTRRSGRITKTGRKDLRATLVRAAFCARRSHPRWIRFVFCWQRSKRKPPRPIHGTVIWA